MSHVSENPCPAGWPALIWLLLASATCLLGCASTARADAPWMVLISPDNSLSFTFLKDGRPVANLGMTGWGPQWAWRGVEAHQKAEDGILNANTTFEVNKDNGQVIDLKLKAWKSGDQSVSFQYTLSAAKDVPLTELVAGISTQNAFQDGNASLTLADGAATTLPLSLALIRAVPAVAKVAFGSKKAGDYSLEIDPPTPLHIDHGMRVLLAADTFKQGSQTVTLKFTFPEAVDFLASQADLDRYTQLLPGPDWFPFTPTKDIGPSVIGFQDWLDKPAGKHGGVRMVGGHFQFEDGAPVKFWGTNLAYNGSAPDKATADYLAARFAKWGVNAVRMHKFTGTGWEGIGDPNDATKMLPAGLDKLDYFASQLAKNGIYYGWSHTYGFHVRPGNRNQLLAYDEIVKNLQGNTYGLINFAEDVQDLMIQMVVNLLKHRNPYTGQTYAEDPALAYIELQNEDDIFFYTSENAFNACPTYKKHFMEEFSDWLKARYGTQDALAKAWGSALKAGQTLEARNIVPETNPWFLGSDHLPGATDGERRWLLDSGAWLHEKQDAFYTRYVKAIRDAGYKGPLVGSPWQAPAMLPHYYNLDSDYKVGYIDRHDYFGGGLFDTMLGHPGSGYLSSGLQQVVDRPFGLSEWIHVYPSLYSAEGPAIVAAYGMGLQGWDASYEFQSSSSDAPFSDTVGTFAYGIWNADTPTQIGQYPALARMIARGDVKESPVISVRRVSLADLPDGKFGFTDSVQQQGDIKTFTGTVPAAALAAGRCVVQFTDTAQTSTFPDMSQYTKGNVITSSTGQLAWDTSGKGFFTINTPGTKAVVGFAADKDCALGTVNIEPACPYASIFVTALQRDTTLANARSALVTAIARACNTGFRYFTVDNRVLDNGKAPILLEPVKATVTLTGRKIAAVNVLDFDGRPTGRTLPVTDGSFIINSADDKSIYYQIVFE